MFCFQIFYNLGFTSIVIMLMQFSLMKIYSLTISSFLTLPSLLLAEEPSSGTLIMISSIGTWVIAAVAIIGIRRFRRARQQQRD